MTSSNFSPDTDVIIVNQLTDYQFIIAPLYTDMTGVVLRCASGLGPAGTMTNDVLGTWYFGGMEITEGKNCGGGFSAVFEVRNAPRRSFPGIINLYPCDSFDPLSSDEEGVYSCRMRNSSMMVQTTRVGLYLSGRSESVDVSHHLIVNHLFISLHSCSNDRPSIIIYCNSCCW